MSQPIVLKKSQAVIAETTCDGKKKMFELIAEIKPTHVMDLPQMPEQQEARRKWKQMIVKLQGFLEKNFDRRADLQRIEAALQASNRKNALMAIRSSSRPASRRCSSASGERTVYRCKKMKAPSTPYAMAARRG